MSQLTTYTRNEVLDHIFSKGAWTMPSNVWLALSTTTPNAAGGNVTEPVGNNYSRVAFKAQMGTASGGVITSTGIVESPVASGSWGTVTHMCVYDAATNGNLLAFAPLPTSQAIGANQKLEFPIGDITSRLTTA